MAMKWYKLLTRFFIWAFAVALLTCGTYGIFNSSDILINTDPFAGINHPTIEKIVIITGIMMICVALLAIISGIALLKRKRSAPKLLTRTLVLWTAVSAFYFFTTMIHFATHSGQEFDIVALEPLVAGHSVSRHGAVCMADVQIGRRIIDGSGNVIIAFALVAHN